jgi:hypothetical protein
MAVAKPWPTLLLALVRKLATSMSRQKAIARKAEPTPIVNGSGGSLAVVLRNGAR